MSEAGARIDIQGVRTVYARHLKGFTAIARVEPTRTKIPALYLRMDAYQCPKAQSKRKRRIKIKPYVRGPRQVCVVDLTWLGAPSPEVPNILGHARSISKSA